MENLSDKYLQTFYESQLEWLRTAVETLEIQNVDALMDDAASEFINMIPFMPYRNDVEHSMAVAAFSCFAMLAVYIPLRKRTVSAHTWGNALLHTEHPKPAPEVLMAEQLGKDRIVSDAIKSQAQSSEGEFVFEAIPGDGENFHWGLNIKSCAICYLFAKYQANDLVPYMCAFDDKLSAEQQDGLRRTGTIALGADECDFRYKIHGKPEPLVERFPDQIRITQIP